MRFAIVSDLHSNLQAWKAVRLDLACAKADRILCLGDVVGYGPDPAGVMESARASAHRFLLGNHDAALCGKMDADLFTDRARRMLEWTRDRLSPDVLRVFERWPLTLRGPGFRCAHGDFSAPGHFRYVSEPEDAEASWRAVPEPLLFVGHSHCADLFVLGASGTPRRVPPQDFALEPGKRYLVSVGSVGQPRDGDPRASYCIWDTVEKAVYWRRVPFDLDDYRRSFAQAGLTGESSPFPRFDPLVRARPARPTRDFHPPESADKAARNVVDVQSLDTLRRQLSVWRMTAWILLLVVAALAGLAGFRHHRAVAERPIIRDATDPLPRIAAHYPADANLTALPDPAEARDATPPGWRIYLGGGTRQSALWIRREENRAVLTLRSGAPDRDLAIQSSEIGVAPRQRFTVEAQVRKSETFRGRVLLNVSVDRRTAAGAETLEHFVFKEPNLTRRGGWRAARETFDLPAGAHTLRVRLIGRFSGEVDVGSVSLHRR